MAARKGNIWVGGFTTVIKLCGLQWQAQRNWGGMKQGDRFTMIPHSGSTVATQIW